MVKDSLLLSSVVAVQNVHTVISDLKTNQISVPERLNVMIVSDKNICDKPYYPSYPNPENLNKDKIVFIEADIKDFLNELIVTKNLDEVLEGNPYVFVIFKHNN